MPNSKQKMKITMVYIVVQQKVCMFVSYFQDNFCNKCSQFGEIKCQNRFTSKYYAIPDFCYGPPNLLLSVTL